MTRKNASKQVTDQGLLFDTRTKAVMAQPAQDGVKEKVQAVREVVPGRSNNEIILVLQYYEYNIDQAIAAFLEDGAKSALQEWHYPGNKAPNKKKKKNKKTQQQQQQQGENADGQNHSQPSGASVQPLTNGGPLQMIKDASNRADTNLPESLPFAAINNTMEASASFQQPLPKRQGRGKTPPSSAAQSTNQSSSHILTDSRVTETRGKQKDHSMEQGGRAFVENGQGDGQIQTHPHVVQEKKGGHSENRPRSRTGSVQKKPEHKDVTRVEETGASHTHSSQSAQQQQQQQQHRPRAGSHHKQHKQQVSHHGDQGSGAGRSGQSHTSSAGPRGHRGPHAGLEKSTKDLQRQTISLHRLKEKFTEGIDKDQKHIQSVFEELHKELNEREALLIYEMDKAKQIGLDVFSMRQEKAVELKQSTDRAQQMNDHELTDLRADIKMFVSDRKIDENLGSTTRFLCNPEHLVEEVRQFGEVVPVKAVYSTRRPSISSVSSSVVSYDDLLSPTLSVTSPPPVFQVNKNTSFTTPALRKHEEDTSEEKGPTAPLLHSDSLTTQELAELQHRLQDSLKKQGLPVHSPPKRGSVPSNQRPAPSNQKPAPLNQRPPKQQYQDTIDTAADEKKSRNARRRQKERERQKRRREDAQQTNQSGNVSGVAPKQQQQQQQQQHQPQQHQRQATSPSKHQSTGGLKKDLSDKPHSENKAQNRRAHSPNKKYQPSHTSTSGKQEGSNDKAHHGTNQGNRKTSERQDLKPADVKVDDAELSADKTVAEKESKIDVEEGVKQGSSLAKDKPLEEPNTNQENHINGEITDESNNAMRETNGNVPYKDANMNETTKDSETINGVQGEEAAENENDALKDHDALPQRKPREKSTTKMSTAILNGDVDIVMNGDVHVNGVDHKD